MKLHARLEEFADFIAYRSARSADEKASVEKDLGDRGCQSFADDPPVGYFPCEENAQLLLGFCHAAGIPLTRTNLDIAFNDLREQLVSAPKVDTPVDKWASVTLARTDALLEYGPSTKETEQLAKVADDVHLSDHARLARDRRLQQLAGEQRRTLAKGNHQ